MRKNRITAQDNLMVAFRKFAYRRYKMRGLFILALICTLHNVSFAGSIPLDKNQTELLEIAYLEGERIGYPETIQGILMQETIAGLLGKVGDHKFGFGKKSYGVMQIRLDTAKFVIQQYPGLGNFKTDEELLARLITDDAFNIRVGTLYFEMLLKRYKKERYRWSKAVSAYNCGLNCGITPYAKKVKKHIHKRIRPFNRYVLTPLVQLTSSMNFCQNIEKTSRPEKESIFIFPEVSTISNLKKSF